MGHFEAALTAEDHSYRRAAQAYFDEKGHLAKRCFAPELLRVFESFEEHWREYFAPSEPDLLREYLRTPFEVRRAKFERFKRECRAWEVSFRIYAWSSPGGRVTNGEFSDLKRRLEEQRAKAERIRQFYDGLDNMLERERQRRSYPFELLAHLRALGLSTDASLADVKKQYKRLAKVHHPDVHGDPAEMSKLNDAYRAILAFYQVA